MGRYYKARLGRWPSGQWQQTVNLPGSPYVCSNHTLPTKHKPREIGAFLFSAQNTS